jgi:ammonia channel protein AmtB
MNTFLAGSSGAIVAFFLGYFSSGVWGLIPLMNGMLTGLVCVTG